MMATGVRGRGGSRGRSRGAALAAPRTRQKIGALCSSIENQNQIFLMFPRFQTFSKDFGTFSSLFDRFRTFSDVVLEPWRSFCDSCHVLEVIFGPKSRSLSFWARQA